MRTGFTPLEERPVPTRKSAAKTKRSTAASESTAATAPETTSECTHTWVIDPPNGPVSEGHCRDCGEHKEFRNSYEYTPSWTARAGGKGASK